MGQGLDSVIEIGTFGLVDDFSGTEAAQEAALKGQEQASAASERTADKSLALQEKIFEWQKGQAEPWRQAGLTAMEGFTGLNEQPFVFDPENDPVYQKEVEEGTMAINRSGAGRGMQLSGRTLGSLQEAVSGGLDRAYTRQYGRRLDSMRNYAALMSQGSGVSTNLGQIGSQYAGGAANTLQQQGSNQAQIAMNTGAINASAATAPFQNLMSLGTMGAGLMQGAGAMGLAFSDVRLKKNIVPAGETEGGTPVYTYNYIWDEDTDNPYLGVMAQEVERTNPDAVKTINGYKAVDYSKVA